MSDMPNIYEGHSVRNEVGGGIEIERMEISEGEEGILLWLKGRPHPIKGMPTAEAIQGVNVIKKMILEIFKHPILLLTPTKTLNSFKEISEKALQGHILQEKYMTRVGRELRGMIGVYAAHIIEYDSAYRVRIQDMFSSVSQDEIVSHPIRTIWKMVKRNRENDYMEIHIKVRKLAILLTLALCIPHIRKQWKVMLRQCTYSNLCLDKGDVYWMNERTDYGPLNQNKIGRRSSK